VVIVFGFGVGSQSRDVCLGVVHSILEEDQEGSWEMLSELELEVQNRPEVRDVGSMEKLLLPE
jgi:hypothetical protein